MSIDKRVVLGGLLAIMLGSGHSAMAQTQSKEPQAAPSQAPKSHATTQAVTGSANQPTNTDVGTEQAAPSQRPAPQATTSAMKNRKSGDN